MGSVSMSSDEFTLLNDGLKRLNDKVDALVSRPEYEANNKSFDLRLSAVESAIKTLASNQQSAVWRVLGWLVTFLLGGGLVELVNVLSH